MGLGQTATAARKQSPPAILVDVKTSGEAAKMRSLLNSDVDLALPRRVRVVNALHACARRWRSKRLHSAHHGNRAYVEFHARRAAAF